MAEDVRRLIEDGALRQRMGAAGVRRTTEQFSLAGSVRMHEELYASLLAGEADAVPPARPSGVAGAAGDAGAQGASAPARL
jgi:hypothetical protein